MKPKKKQHFKQEESEDFPIKQKKKSPKKKHMHPRLWMLEEEYDEEILEEKEASVIYFSKDWGEA